MTFAKTVLCMGALLTLCSCGGGSSSSGVTCSQANSTDNPTAPSGNGIVPIAINNSNSEYPNEPVVSVKICVPGSTTNCQTIDNVLLDTGSYGLRIFRSLITIPVTPYNDQSGNLLAECVAYGTGSQWGALTKVDIVLGGETASSVNMQEVDPAYPAGIPSESDCASGTDQSPSATGYNGILGVGLFDNDCGAGCTDSNETYYFSCASNPCTPESVSASYQVENPVAQMPSDYNNGIAVTLPSVPACGSSNVAGYMALGIGTESNNTPASSVTVLAASSESAQMFTIWQGTQDQAFIDSGSNSLSFYPTSDTTPCDGNSGVSGFLCPSDSPSYSATMQAATGTAQVSVPFQVVNADSLVSGGNSAFSTLAGEGVLGNFDWGISFFYGKTVYIGIVGTTSTLGTGPYWAF